LLSFKFQAAFFFFTFTHSDPAAMTFFAWSFGGDAQEMVLESKQIPSSLLGVALLFLSACRRADKHHDLQISSKRHQRPLPT
jgi:hypothetical protein